MLSCILVQLTIVLAASRSNAPSVFREAATVYEVDTEAIAQKVKAEFAAKAKVKKEATLAKATLAVKKTA
jgi:ParB family chromosome partitioning protein